MIAAQKSDSMLFREHQQRLNDLSRSGTTIYVVSQENEFVSRFGAYDIE